MEADLRVGDVGHCDEGVPGSGDQGDPHPLGLAVLEHPHRDAKECEQGQGLVGFPFGTILLKGTKSPGGRCPKTVPAGA